MTRMIFVYGSLMTGFWNHTKAIEGHLVNVDAGYITGSLYHLRNKGYPAFVEGGETRVYGEILSVTDYKEVRRKMDEIESYGGPQCSDNEYKRLPLEVTVAKTGRSMTLDVYVYNSEAGQNCQDELEPISHGDWRRFMSVDAVV